MLSNDYQNVFWKNQISKSHQQITDPKCLYSNFSVQLIFTEKTMSNTLIMSTLKDNIPNPIQQLSEPGPGHYTRPICLFSVYGKASHLNPREAHDKQNKGDENIAH